MAELGARRRSAAAVGVALQRRPSAIGVRRAVRVRRVSHFRSSERRRDPKGAGFVRRMSTICQHRVASPSGGNREVTGEQLSCRAASVTEKITSRRRPSRIRLSSRPCAKRQERLCAVSERQRVVSYRPRASAGLLVSLALTLAAPLSATEPGRSRRGGRRTRFHRPRRRPLGSHGRAAPRTCFASGGARRGHCLHGLR
jgi:hypothetical protein